MAARTFATTSVEDALAQTAVLQGCFKNVVDTMSVGIALGYAYLNVAARLLHVSARAEMDRCLGVAFDAKAPTLMQWAVKIALRPYAGGEPRAPLQLNAALDLAQLAAGADGGGALADALLRIAPDDVVPSDVLRRLAKQSSPAMRSMVKLVLLARRLVGARPKFKLPLDGSISLTSAVEEAARTMSAAVSTSTVHGFLDKQRQWIAAFVGQDCFKEEWKTVKNQFEREPHRITEKTLLALVRQRSCVEDADGASASSLSLCRFEEIEGRPLIRR